MKVVIPVYGSRRWALVNGKAQKACFSVFPITRGQDRSIHHRKTLRF